MTNLSFTASMQDYDNDKCLIALSVHDADFINDCINHYMLSMSNQSSYADITQLHEKRAKNIQSVLSQIICYHDEFWTRKVGSE